MKTTHYLFLIVSLSVFLNSCSTSNNIGFKNHYYTENELMYAQKKDTSLFLKAHDYYGNVFIFNKSWVVDTTEKIVKGKGKLYNPERDLIDDGALFVHIDSVALFETNSPIKKVNHLLLPKTLLVMYNMAMAGFCLSVPKACFGSCPTFYTSETQNVFDTRAECFSNAISPSMEYEDIDDLSEKVSGGKHFSVTMKNEALETHMVNYVRLHVLPVKEHQYVLHGTDQNYYIVSQDIFPENASTTSENITTQLLRKDEAEWTSLADVKKLVTNEEIILSFPAEALSNRESGLKLTYRQTLLTTYMLYHAISYMGNEYSDILSSLERKKLNGTNVYSKFSEALGGIEVYIEELGGNENKWKYQGMFHETGPIAKNTQLCPLGILPEDQKNLRVKLVFNKGLWRFDEAILTTIEHKPEPVILHPEKVLSNGIEDVTGLIALNSDQNI
ncbi:MAG: hypothetical protein IPN79_01350 [Saprospiraceae bacterium]|nr:hypothetical protein [Saprospiraceae bacterium]